MKLFLPFFLFISQNIFAADGLNPFKFQYVVEPGTQAQLTNMPRVRSQDSFGICYAFAASVLFDEANCANKQGTDCASMSDDQKVSPIDLARFSVNLSEDKDSRDRYSYEGLKEGGSAALALYNAKNTQHNARESCAPFDHLVAKTKDPNEAQKIELAMWKKFQDSYETYKKKSKECVACGLEYATAKSQELKDQFNLKTSNQEILQAFAQDTYNKFLDTLLVPEKCWEWRDAIELNGGWGLKTYPQVGEKSDYNQMLAMIKKNLANKRPMAFAFCTQEPLTVKSIKECNEAKNASGTITGFGHEVVIKGYRRVCKVNAGKTTKECYDAVQVQNSWGQSWQNENDDGWVDAKQLLDRSFYEKQTLTWLER
nr:hypothetical protein BdHM001_00760 [Bdellovibrio sp. HM001]